MLIENVIPFLREGITLFFNIVLIHVMQKQHFGMMKKSRSIPLPQFFKSREI
jgi:hypothetical protein